MKLTRKELYDKVWEQPMTKVAPTLGLSDVGLAKVCRKYQIPRPRVGYWAKLAHGKTVEREELPSLDDESLSEIIAFRENFDKDDPVPSRPKVVVKVDDKLTKPHEHVRCTRTILKSVKPDDHGIVQSPEHDCLNINVSKKSQQRALRIFDAITKAWEQEGGTVELRPTEFCFGKDGVCISLTEVVRRFEKNPDKNRYWKQWSYEATGRLSLEISGYGDGLRKTWKDGKIQIVEDVLGNFISTLHDWMEHHKLRRLDQECTERQKAKAAKRRAIVQEKKELEQARRKELMEFVEAWENAERIRKYLSAVESKIESNEVAPSDPESFSKWLEWAHWYADMICPITHSKPRDESVEVPECCDIAELDLTRQTREELARLPIKTTDELYDLDREFFREHCVRRYWSVWNEVTLVLEGLGYDTSKREKSYW